MATIIIASAAALMGLGITAWVVRQSAPEIERVSASTSSESTESDAVESDAIPAASAPYPNYRFSIVAGGVHSQDDVVRAVDRDEVVAEHYRDISLASVRTETLTQPRRAYVSYRIGDQVYWTKHKVALPAGEAILTDGVSEIRARCGNRISDEPQAPNADNEPEAVEFDALAPAGSPVTAPAVAVLSPVLALPPPELSVPMGLSASLPGSSTGPAGTNQPFGTPFLIGGPAIGSPVDSDESDAPDQGVLIVIPLPPVDGGGNGGSNPGDGTSPVPPDIITDPSKPGGGTPPDDVVLTPPGNPPIPFIPPTTTVDDGPGPNPGGNLPLDVQPVPEPGTLLLVGSGALGAAWRRLRARRRN